ncbi:MAG TPA: hypothetical protein VM099_16315 [Gemmatimonadaceae bacterium]|nr:hypothetical protein [Gemmatimonadaceae bacterium]
MRKSKFSDSQIVGILRNEESGVPVVDLLRKYVVSKARFKRRNKYGGASVSDVKRLREAEHEGRGEMRPLRFLYVYRRPSNYRFTSTSHDTPT